MCNKEFTLTQEGYDELFIKADRLEKEYERRCEALDRAIAKYGLHDDEYQLRVRRKLRGKQRLDDVRECLEHAQIIDSNGDNIVDLGDSVRLVNHKICYQVQVVDEVEANPLAGRVSDKSPIGANVIGKLLGDTIWVQLPQEKIEFKIAEIF